MTLAPDAVTPEIVPDGYADQSQCLSVNAQRHKVAPAKRRRVARACRACQTQRVRCSGDQPCHRCLRGSRECEYQSPESDKNALRCENERLRKRCAALEQSLRNAAPQGATEDLFRQHDPNESTSRFAADYVRCSSTSQVDDAETTEGRLLFDPDGSLRYLGETSGATFLDNLKQFMLTLVPLTFEPESRDGSAFVASVGQYQTSDSQPLPNPDVDPLWLPPRTDMALMLTELRYHIQDGSGDFPYGGIYWWGDLSSLPSAPSSTDSLDTPTTADTYRYLAFYHVCFALALSVQRAPFHESDERTRDVYFKRARLLIGNPLDNVHFSLSDVPVLTLMGFYLMWSNRRDAAYIHIGLAIHIAIAHGAFTQCVDEAHKRVCWTLYILDRWLSILLGRPATLSDGSIKIPLPEDSPSMPPAAGLRAHVELARISGHIVGELFRVASQNPRSGYSAENIDRALQMLENWQSQLPASLALPHGGIELDHTCCALHMAHNQLVLLTTRPILFATVKRAVAERYVGGTWCVEQHPHYRYVQACTEAAHRNIALAQHITQTSRRLLQASLHFVFNAAIVLLLYPVLQVSPSDGLVSFNESDPGSPPTPPPPPPPPPPEAATAAAAAESAICMFEEEAKTGSAYSHDCCKVLQGLRELMNRYLWTLSRPRAPLDNVASRIHNAPLPQEGADFYGELMSWMQSDDLQLHKSLFN